MRPKKTRGYRQNWGWHVKQAGSDPSHYNLIFKWIALDIGCPIKWNFGLLNSNCVQSYVCLNLLEIWHIFTQNILYLGFISIGSWKYFNMSVIFTVLVIFFRYLSVLNLNTTHWTMTLYLVLKRELPSKWEMFSK